MPPDEDATPAKDGFVMFLSFIAFGLIPIIRKCFAFHFGCVFQYCCIIAYMILVNKTFGEGEFNPLFLVSSLLAAAAMFLLGVVKVCLYIRYIM
jgi:hypothetical protein